MAVDVTTHADYLDEVVNYQVATSLRPAARAALDGLLEAIRELTAEPSSDAATEGPRMEKEFTTAELVQIAKGNHMWLNAFACIRPDQEFLAAIGGRVIDCFDTSPILDDFIQRPHNVTYVRFNRS